MWASETRQNFSCWSRASGPRNDVASCQTCLPGVQANFSKARRLQQNYVQLRRQIMLHVWPKGQRLQPVSMEGPSASGKWMIGLAHSPIWFTVNSFCDRQDHHKNCKCPKCPLWMKPAQLEKMDDAKREEVGTQVLREAGMNDREIKKALASLKVKRVPKKKPSKRRA